MPLQGAHVCMQAHVQLCCQPLQAIRAVPKWQELPSRPLEPGGEHKVLPTGVEFALLPSIFQHRWGPHVLCCGHKLHLPCLDKYR